MKAKIISSMNMNQQKWFGTHQINFMNQCSGEKNLVYADLTFAAGEGLDFHQHPNQTEVLYLLSGKLEVWIGNERKYIKTGDTLRIPAGKIHACFNRSNQEARIFTVLSSNSDEDLGFELIDKSQESPWNSLR